MAVGLPPTISSQNVDPNRAQTEPQRFQELVQTLSKILGPSSGLDAEDVDLDGLMQAMERYNANESGWVKYALPNPKIEYTRNLVDEGNGKANLLVLVWTPGQGSPIHDHGNAHCVMKILRGSLTESRYEFPKGNTEQEMKLKSQTTHQENEVAYMADSLGLHKMENKGDDYAVSLHLYTPPSVAKIGCNIFKAKTGERTFRPSDGGGYFSKFAERV